MCQTTADPTVNWYALYVRTGHEMEIADEINVKVSGVRALCPSEIVDEWRGGKWVQKQRILFAGYVFLQRHGDSSASLYYALKAIPGVIRWIGHGEGTAWASIPPTEMAMVLLLGNNGQPFGASCGVKRGGSTCITSGPLMGLEHLIQAVYPHRRRARLAIPLLGETKHMEVTLRIDKCGQDKQRTEPGG